MNRDRFPGLRDGWARLDGPAGTQMVDVAIDAMGEFMASGRNANHGGAFAAGRATDEVISDARAAAGDLLGADPGGVAFGPSMTGLTMRFAATVARTLEPGDEIVCTRLDHDANVRPWTIAAERAGVTVRFAEPERERLELPAAAIEEVLSERTRWVAVTHASNAVGTIADLPGIVAAARGVGARVYVDAVHAAPHRPIDLRALGADVIVCSAYKWFGPHVGILAAAPELLASYEPGQARPVARRGARPLGARHAAVRVARRRDGGGALRDGRRLGSRPRPRGRPAAARRSTACSAIDGVTLYGDARDRTPTLMFNVEGLTSLQTARSLAEREVAVWHGNYYAWELERLLGLAPDGAVRAGFVHYNDERTPTASSPRSPPPSGRSRLELRRSAGPRVDQDLRVASRGRRARRRRRRRRRARRCR